MSESGFAHFLSKAAPLIDRLLAPALSAVTLFASIRSISQGSLAPLEILRGLIIPFVVLSCLYFSKPPKIRNLTWNGFLGIILSFGGFYLFKDSNNKSLPLSLMILGIANTVFYFGLILWSYLSLGRNIGIVPALRSLVSSGPFSLIRHPIYSCYAHLAFTYALILPCIQNFFAASVVAVGLWLRSEQEDKILSLDASYAKYKASVLRRFWHPLITSPSAILACLCLASYGFTFGPRPAKNEIIRLQIAYPINSTSPIVYDDWSSTFLGNHIYRRFISEPQRPQALAITDNLVLRCAEDPTDYRIDCPTVQFEFAAKPFQDCMGRIYSAKDIQDEILQILSKKTWILPSATVCKTTQKDHICMRGNNSPELKRHLRNLYFRFGWSKQQASDQKIGAGPYCLTPSQTNSNEIHSGVLVPISASSELRTIQFETSLASDAPFNIALFGTPDLLQGTRLNVATHTPLGYYLVTNPALRKRQLPWNSPEAIKTLRAHLEKHGMIYPTIEGFAKVLPQGTAHEEFVKLKSIGSKQNRILVLPEYIPDCQGLSLQLSLLWISGGLRAKAVCKNTSSLIEDIIKRKFAKWDAFLSPLSPGAPGRMAVHDQYFSSQSKESWTGSAENSQDLFSLIGVGRSFVTIDGVHFCGLNPNSMGLGDIILTDFIPCQNNEQR